MAVDMHSIAALVGSLQAAAEITKGLISLRDTATLQVKVIELLEEILSAQSSALAAQSDQLMLLNRVRELEEKMAKIEAWATEKQNYELKMVGTGTFAYAPKPGVNASEPMHLLCAACYQNQKNSILQFHSARQFSDNSDFRCPECKTIIIIHPDVFVKEP